MTTLEKMALAMLKKQTGNVLAQEAAKIIESGDTEAGIKMARNLCETNGVSEEEGLKMAQNWAQNQAFPGQ